MKRKEIAKHIDSVGVALGSVDMDGIAKVVKPSRDVVVAIQYGIELGLAFSSNLLEMDMDASQLNEPMEDAAHIFTVALNMFVEDSDD